jgi:4-amino-4-deoxy-L-arabinose transferase-like glycosyltransferase
MTAGASRAAAASGAGLAVSSETDRRLPLSAALAVGAIVAARLVLLAFSPAELDVEESQYWFWSLVPDWGYGTKPPLIAWIIGLERAVCGDAAFCIRAGSPILHGGTALFAGAIAARLAGGAAGFWAALVYATAPGVWFSSNLMSTDVPMLFCWSAALYAVVRLRQGGGYAWAAAAGAAVGVGMLAKYAMAAFLAEAALYLALAPAARRAIAPGKLAVVVLIAAAAFAPNVIWNALHGGVTLSHTVANANLGGDLIRPLRMLEFAASQFAVIGPVLLVALIVVAVQRRKFPLPAAPGDMSPREHFALLACFAFPYLILMLGQSLLSRAHPNWAVSAYVAGGILVVVAQIGRREFWWVKWSVIVTLAVTMAASLWGAAGTLAALGPADPKRLMPRFTGWAELGREVARLRRENGDAPILSFERDLLAHMSYYARIKPGDARAWSPAPVPRNHFELTAPLREGETRPHLFISQIAAPAFYLDHFATTARVGEIAVTLPSGAVRRHYVYRVEGFVKKYADAVPGRPPWHARPPGR